MGTRRPMSRVSPSNGRYYDSLGSSNGSASESDDSNGSAYSPRADSRSYLLNVRPENSRSSISRYSNYTSGRTTFCSIISQLTEETQPCFETTLKARAVSEGCDAKFICMVTGHPEPEVTWYKDDEEMDRYCGLPKYEIFRNGKRHTLQIYKCREEDAAIYQASARNNKGIVSCSGVLEVGTMTEYKIHQRWFAKLKRKAEAKMREIEQSRRKVKENLDEGERLRALSPERIQRKRRFSSENKEDMSPSAVDKEELIKVHIPDPNTRLQEEENNKMQQPLNVVNGFTVLDKPQGEEVITNGYSVPEKIDENGKEFLAYVYETVEVITKKPTSKESYAKKKKKEEEPSIPPIAKVDPKRDEVTQGSSPKKGEGISPAPRRSRFTKDVTKPLVEEKMEVQPVPVTSNRRFATTTAPPKIGKTIAKDTKKQKEAVVPKVKAGDSSTSKQTSPSPMVEVNFSLKDMFFGESLQAAEEEKVQPSHEPKVSSVVKQDVSSPAKTAPQRQSFELPKAAPRRSKEQRELSAGRKPLTSSTTTVVPEAEIPKENQNIQEVKPACDILQQHVVENIVETPATVEALFQNDIPEQSLKKTDSSEPVLISSQTHEPRPLFDHKEKSPIQGQIEKEIHKPETSSEKRTASEDPLEEASRAETLRKLQNLENEYMALQKAYALLQQQLELSQKAEAEKIKERELLVSSEPLIPKQISSTESNVAETEKSTDGNDNLVKCPSSPLLVDMETDESISTEVIPLVDSVKQSEEGGVHQHAKSEIDLLRPLHSPVSFMECGSDDRVVEMEDRDSKGEETLQPSLITRESSYMEGEASRSDIIVHKPKDVTHVSEAEHAPVLVMLSTEVEMMEDVKQPEQSTEMKENKSENSQRYVIPVLEKKSIDSSTEPASTLTSLEVVNTTLTEKSFQLSSDESSAPIQENVEEISKVENIVDTHLSGATSSEIIIPSDPDQSVATLLRDVKAALESGITKVVESSSESSSGSALSPLVIPSPEEYVIESMLPLPQEEEKSVMQNPVMPDMQNSTLKSPQHLSEIEVSTVTTDVPSQSERLQNEVVQQNVVLKEQGKQDNSLVTTLKNSLLMLLHMKPADVVEGKKDDKDRIKECDAQSISPGELSSPEGSLSPPSSRKMYTSAKDNDSPQSVESMHSSSTSGKLTPASEEDMVQSVDSSQTSPVIHKKSTESSKKGTVVKVESAPLSPVTPRRSSKGIPVETVLSKEDLSFSPSTTRKIAAKIASNTDISSSLSVPSIVVGSLPAEKTLGSMFFDSETDSSRKWRSTENLSLIPSATPQELASGARRKIYLPKSRQLDDSETVSTGSLTPPSKRESPNVSPGQSRRSTSLLSPQSPPAEKRSPGTVRRMTMLEVPKIYEESPDKGNTSDDSSLPTKDLAKEVVQPLEPKKVSDPYKAPQVIRKIRAEQFSDASGNLKLWCQFFNILSDSSITWYKDEVPVAKVKRCSGDEGQVALAIVQASTKDCGVYQCTIENSYGTDSTDCLLSSEILSGFISKEEVEVGEEIEMTPMVFAKGLADSSYWGDKFFGRIVMEDAHVGNGFLRKSCRVKVIYGLEPIFESGKTCIIKIRNLITFGTKNESTLVEKNYELTIQECKIQNTTREYCKIFAAECRVVPNFGQLPDILPLNVIYRPANNVPYATIEEDLEGRFEKYCIRDLSGKLHVKNSTEIEQKCCTFQHWVYQWTNGNFLVTTLEGVGWKLTNVGIATNSKGYQGLKESYPAVIEEFPLFHQCNTYCEMLGLKSLKATEGLQPPAKPKASRSPTMARKSGSAQSSPQMQKKGLTSPQSTRKGGVSPKASRKATETGDAQSAARNRANEGSSPAKSQ
ncbi:alpha-protein kinase 3 [Rhinophrynus dorsalis]